MSETLANANGLSLCYETFGDPTQPPLVLVMGLAAQMIVWDDDFCEALAAAGHWVVRFDNRDIGHSTTFPKARTPRTLEMMFAQVTRVRRFAPYALRDMAADTVGLLDALDIPSAHVVGASMGGMIAQELAIRYPERLRTLTSIMSSTGAPKLPGPTPRALQVLGRRTPLDRDGYVRDYVDTWMVLAGGRLPFDARRLGRQGARGYDRGLNPAGVARQLYAIVASGDRTEALHDVTTPALVIHGTNDPLVPVEAGQATAAAIPGARLVLIEGMGHYFPPELWPRIIEEIVQHTHAYERSTDA